MQINCCSRKLMKAYALLFILFSFYACGVPNEQYNALKNENLLLQAKIDTLTNEVNDLKFGAEALLKKAKLKIKDGEYQAAKELLTTITDKYYNSSEASTARELIIEVIPKIEESAFETARSDPGTSLLESYIQQYPNGRFLNMAQQILEERDWELAIKKNRVADLQSFVTKYPNSAHVTEANELLIKYEVGEVFNGTHNSLPPLQKEYDALGNNDVSVHKVENLTSYTLTILYSGPEQRRLTIPAKETKRIWLKNGSYRIVASVDAPNVTNCAGEEYLTGSYSTSYFISSSRSSYPNSYSRSSASSYPASSYYD